MKSNFDEGRPYKIKIHTGNNMQQAYFCAANQIVN